MRTSRMVQIPSPAATGSMIALAVGRVYVNLTPAFPPQALTQDIANLVSACASSRTPQARRS